MATSLDLQLAESGTEGNKRFPQTGFAFDSELGAGDWKFLEADVIPQFSVTMSAKFTQFPLENGALATDHVVHDPDVFTVIINQTNTPIAAIGKFDWKPLKLEQPTNSFQPGGLLALATKVSGLIALALGKQKKTFDIQPVVLQGNDGNRIDKLWVKLQRIKEDCAPCMLVVAGRAYVNIFITNLEYSRQGAQELGVFTLTCQRLLFVSTEASKLAFPTPQDNVNVNSADLGKKPPVKEELVDFGLSTGITTGLLPPGQ